MFWITYSYTFKCVPDLNWIFNGSEVIIISILLHHPQTNLNKLNFHCLIFSFYIYLLTPWWFWTPKCILFFPFYVRISCMVRFYPDFSFSCHCSRSFSPPILILYRMTIRFFFIILLLLLSISSFISYFIKRAWSILDFSFDCHCSRSLVSFLSRPNSLFHKEELFQIKAKSCFPIIWPLLIFLGKKLASFKQP